MHRTTLQEGDDVIHRHLPEPRRSLVGHPAHMRGEDKVLQLMRQLRRVELQAPVHAGQVVLPNAADTGVDVKTSAAAPRARPPT